MQPYALIAQREILEAPAAVPVIGSRSDNAVESDAVLIDIAVIIVLISYFGAQIPLPYAVNHLGNKTEIREQIFLSFAALCTKKS